MLVTKYFPIRIFDDIFIISIYDLKYVIQIFAIDNNFISDVLLFVNNNRHWLCIFSTKNMNLRSLSFLIEILSLLYNKYYAFRVTDQSWCKFVHWYHEISNYHELLFIWFTSWLLSLCLFDEVEESGKMCFDCSDSITGSSVWEVSDKWLVYEMDLGSHNPFWCG